jgi:hypothetical protein
MLKTLPQSSLLEQIQNWFTQKDIHNRSYFSHGNVIAKYDDISRYSDIYDKNISKRKIATKVDLEYSKHIQFGATVSHVKKTMPGKAYLMPFSSQGVNRKVILYRIKIGNQKVKVEMHFYKNQLFFYKFIYSYASPTERRELTRALISKYNLPNIDVTSHTIFDKSRNCVQVDDYIEFSISFTEMENPIFTLIEDIKHKSHSQMVNSYNQSSRALFSSL